MTSEGTRAQHWRQDIMGLSLKELSELTGYSVTAIRCFEANANTSGELLGEKAWQRYRMACLGVLWNHSRDLRERPLIFNWTQEPSEHAKQQRR